MVLISTSFAPFASVQSIQFPFRLDQVVTKVVLSFLDISPFAASLYPIPAIYQFTTRGRRAPFI